jgi:protoporphyrinogen/coproporphyrinogen III oxidase
MLTFVFMPATNPSVIVVGAGVAGLAAAYRLQQHGAMVTVLEAADRVGGKTASVHRDGFIVNIGATVLAGSYRAMLDIAREVGAGDAVFAAPAVIGVYRDGVVHKIRGGGFGAIVDFVRTPLLSPKSKLMLAKMAPDLLRARTKVDYGDAASRAELDTETIAEYCDRRLNSEICDHLLDPVLGGIFVVEGRLLSTADLWFTIWKVLLGGLLGYRGGMEFFAKAVAARLNVRTGATVTKIARSERGAQIQWEDADGRHDEQVDGIVVTTSAPQAAEIFPEVDPALKRVMLDRIEQANLISIRLGLSRCPATKAVLVVAGSGQLGGLAAVSYEHSLSPGSAPAGKGLIGVLPYHEWVTPRLELSDDQLLAEVLPDLERVEPGITDLIEFAEITRWTPGALKLTCGTQRAIAEINRLIDPCDRVQLAGDYVSMPSVNGSVVSGEAAAGRLAAALGLGQSVQ